MLPHETGTYALILKAEETFRLKVGKLGSMQVEPGFYIYVGSAFGPGGLAARVKHHVRRPRKNHWHIDYLRRKIELVEIWYSCEPRHLEHAWAAALSELDNVTVPLPGFGASDCACKSHLFYSEMNPSVLAFEQALKQVIAGAEVLVASLVSSRSLA